MYASQGTGNSEFTTPAALEVIKVKKRKLVLEDNQRIDLPSFAATNAAVFDDQVYVTTGNTGGLYLLDPKRLNVEAQIVLHDARWVDVANDKVVVAQGTPGQLSVFDQKNMELLATYPINGAHIPESKTTVQILDRTAVVAADPGGTALVNLDDGIIMATVPLPLVPELDPSVVVTNAVSADGNLMFISNGEAGVYLAEAGVDFIDADKTDLQNIEFIGKLRFDNLESVNLAEYRKKR